MSDFFKTFLFIYVLYFCEFGFCGFFEQMERHYLNTYDFSELKKHNTRINRLLLLMLNEYKYLPKRGCDRYSPHRRRERTYFYYSKKVCKYIMLLALPWFATFYFMSWYLNEMFLGLNTIFWITIMLLPVVILSVMTIICDVKSMLYRRKTHNNKNGKKV